MPVITQTPLLRFNLRVIGSVLNAFLSNAQIEKHLHLSLPHKSPTCLRGIELFDSAYHSLPAGCQQPTGFSRAPLYQHTAALYRGLARYSAWPSYFWHHAHTGAKLLEESFPLTFHCCSRSLNCSDDGGKNAGLVAALIREQGELLTPCALPRWCR